MVPLFEGPHGRGPAPILEVADWLSQHIQDDQHVAGKYDASFLIRKKILSLAVMSLTLSSCSSFNATREIDRAPTACGVRTLIILRRQDFFFNVRLKFQTLF